MPETGATYYYITALDTNADYWCYSDFDEDDVLYSNKAQAEAECEKLCAAHRERMLATVEKGNQDRIAAWERRRNEHQALYVAGLRREPFAEAVPTLREYKESLRWPQYTIETITLRFASPPS